MVDFPASYVRFLEGNSGEVTLDLPPNEAVKATKNLEKSQAGSTSGWLPKPNQLLEAWQSLCHGHKENGGNVGMGAP